MPDFKEKNRFKVNRRDVSAEEVNKEGLEGFSEVKVTSSEVDYRFTADEGQNIQKDLQALLSERLEGMPADADLVMDNKKAKELEKKNKKYSAKDRKDSMALCKEIRTKTMSKVKEDFEKKKAKKKPLTPLDEIKSKERMLDLDAKASEAYIQALTYDEKKEKVDLAMNKMRCIYRKIGVYMEYLRVENALTPSQKLEVEGKVEHAKAELKKYLGNTKIVNSGYFSWDRVIPKEMMIVNNPEVPAVPVVEEVHEDVHEEEQVQEQQQEGNAEDNVQQEEAVAVQEKKKFEWNDKLLEMAKTGILSKNQKKKNQEEWFVKDHLPAVEAWFKEQDEMDEDHFAAKLIEINGYIRKNIGSITLKCRDKELSDLTLGFSELEQKLIDDMIADSRQDICSDEFKEPEIAAIRNKYSDSFKKYQTRKEKLEKDKDFDLANRGADIWKSKAMQRLVIDGSFEDPKVMEALKKQIMITDKALEKIIAKHGFFVMKDMAKKHLKDFLGDEALFGNLKRVKFKADQYISMLSLYNPAIAQIQKDFVSAYKAKVKGVFAGSFDEAAQYYLGRFADWKSNKDRKQNMKDRLARVGIFAELLQEKTENSFYTQKEWERLASEAREYIRNELSTVLVSADKEKAKEECKEAVNKFYKEFNDDVLKKREEALKRKKKAGKENEPEPKVLTQKEWNDRVNEKTGKWKADQEGKNISDIPSYLNMLKGKELLESQEVQDILVKQEERDFLADNLDQIILKNDELAEKLPFMANVKGMDQLEMLSQDQFEQLCKHLKDNICDESLKENYKKIVRNGSLENDKARRNILLKAFRNKQTPQSLINIIKEEQLQAEKEYNAQKTRLLLGLGTSRELEKTRNLSFDHNEMPDKRADGKVIARRQTNMRKAAIAWKKLEELGPEATAQMKIWIESLIGSKNTAGVIRNRNARRFLAWLSGAKEIESDSKFFKWLGTDKIEIEKSMSKIYTADPQLQAAYEKRCAENKKEGEKNMAANLLDDIREIFSSGFDPGELLDNLEEGTKEEKEKLKYDYGIELCLCGAQDVLMDPESDLFKAFFSENNDTYKAAIEEASHLVLERMERLDNDLAQYPDAVQKLLKKKLRRNYLLAKDNPTELLDRKKQEKKRIEEDKEERKKRLDKAEKSFKDGNLTKQLRAEEEEKWKKEIADREKDIKDKETAISNRKKEISGKEDKLEQTGKAIGAGEKENKTAQDKLAEQQRIFKELADSESAQEAIVLDNNIRIDNLKRSNADITAEIAKNEQLIAAKVKEYYLPKQTQKKSIQKTLDETREKNKKLNKQLDDNKSQINKLNKEIKKAEKKKEGLKASLVSEREKLEECQEKVRLAKEALDNNNAEYRKLSKELEELGRENDRAGEELVSKKQRLDTDKKIYTEESKKRKQEDEQAKKDEEKTLKILRSMVEEGDAQDNERLKKLEAEINALGNTKEKADAYNHKMIGVKKLEELADLTKKHIDKDGVMDKELQDTVKLFEERMSMLDKVEGGKLKSVSSYLIEDDSVLGALMDPANSVAEKKIKELGKKFAQIGELLQERPEHIKRVFLKDNLAGILNNKADDNKDKEYWRKAISTAEEKYFSQKKGQKGSIFENMAMGEEICRDYIKNYTKHHSTVIHNAESFKLDIDMVVTSDPELFMELFTQKGAANLYKRITKNFDPNKDTLEKEFYRQMYLYEEAKKIQKDSEDGDDEVVRWGNAAVNNKELEKFKKEWIKKTGEDKAKAVLNSFENQMIGNIYKLTNKEFKKIIGEKAHDFVDNYMQYGLKSDVLKTQSEEERLKHENAKKEASDKAMLKRSQGEKAFNDLMFGSGDMADKISALSKTGSSLAYNVYNNKAKPMSEDDTSKLLNKAWKTLSKEKEGVKVPSILTDIMAEYKILKNEIEDAKDEEEETKSRSAKEAKRLWKIYEYGSGTGNIEEKALDLFTVYAARYWDGKKEEGLKKVSDRFKNLYASIKELQSLSIKDAAVKAEHADVCNKMMLYAFEKGEALEIASLNAGIIRQKEYFTRMDKVYGLMKEVMKEHEYTKNMDDLSKEQYIKGLSEYLRADVINNTINDDGITRQIKEVLSDSYLRASVSHGDTAVSSIDFFESRSYPGAVKLRDFEKKIKEMAPEEYIKEYNDLSIEQRQMFAVALYASRQEESGSQRVIFGVKEEELKQTRDQFKKYIKGQELDLNVDYGRSLRKLISKTGDTKEHLSETMFREALEFVKKVEKKKEELRPKDWERIDDAKATIEAARSGKLTEQYAADEKIIKKPPQTQAKFMETLTKLAEEDKARQKDRGFFTKLGGGFGALRWFKGQSIDDLMKQVNALKPYQMRMLVYVLQNRSALDFSTAGKSEEEKTYSYANKKKRFELIEELTDESRNMIALTEADSAEMVEKAMLSLMSYQLKDNQELSEGSLTKDDFAEGALERYEAVDWKLLLSAINLVQEIDNERLRMYTVQQATERFKNDCDKLENINDGDAAQKLYLEMKDKVEEKRDSFEDFINKAAKRDMYGNNGDQEEIDALMSGYMALTDKEKALFVRALEHRDILDISQRNLYRNYYSADAERDFVNKKGRDDLIDEYLLNASGTEGRVVIKEDSYKKAFESLLSTQIDDSLDFTAAKMISWGDKKLTVDKQLLVKKRKTAMDWKLFARALQFVTRASNECKMAAGDNEIYRSTGNVLELGRMSFDRSFLRSNIHRSGSRLARFIASQSVDLASEKLGFLGTLADLSEFVVNEETSNFIHEQVNPFLKKKDDDDEDDDDDDDDDDDNKEATEEKKENADANAAGGEENKQEEEQKTEQNAEQPLNEEEKKKAEEEKKKAEEEKKKADEEKADAERRKDSEVVKNLSDLAGAYSEHKKKILKISGSLKTAYNEVGKDIYNKIFGGGESGREVAEKDKLADKIGDVKVEGPKKIENVFDVVEKGFETVDNILAKPGEILGRLSTEDFGLVGTIYKYASMGVGYALQGKEMLDKYLTESPEMLESVDNAIKSYLGGFISTQAIGEWYGKNIKGNINKGIKFVVDDRIPKEVQDAIKSMAESVGKSKDFLGKIADYLDASVGIAVAFKGIYDNVQNIRELSKVKGDSKEKAIEDQKKLDDTKDMRNEKQQDMVEKAAAMNKALASAATDTAKHIQQRQILDHIGDAAEGVGKILTTFDKKFSIVGLGVDAAVTIFQKGLATASYIMHCLNDASMLKDWFNGAGRDTAERMEAGKIAYQRMNEVEVGPALAEQINGEEKKEEKAEELPTLLGKIRVDGKNVAREYTGKDVTFTRRAMGFESNEELNCYMALNMVHAMLFTASDYNVLEEPKMMAKVTMTVLGLEDSIGKTDSDTAMKIYAKLRE